MWWPADTARRVTGFVGVLAEYAAELGIDQDAAFAVIEFDANIVLFTPFALALAVLAPRLRLGWLVAAGAGASILVEVVQLAVPGRVSTVSDVVANTIGTVCGVLVLVLVRRRARSASLRRQTPR